MSDERKYQRAGQTVGTGRVKGFKNKWDQRLEAPWQRVTQLRHKGLSDAPNRFYQAGTEIGEGPKEDKKNVIYDRPLSVAVAKAQQPDLNSYSFDQMTIDTDIAAATNSGTMLTVTITHGVRAVIRKFGWYTVGAALPDLQFGLYVGAELVAPGGKLVPGGIPSIQTVYSPSGGSIAFEDLAECAIPVEPDNDITIRVTNNDPLIAHPVWCRVWGWAWEEEIREGGERAYFNKRRKKVM